MPTMPAITHVAVTVNDLAVSVPWYTRLFGTEPVLDENTGPFHHTVYLLGNTLFGVHGFPELQSNEPNSVAMSGPKFCIGREYRDQPPAVGEAQSTALQALSSSGPQIVRSPAHRPSDEVAGFLAVATQVQGGIFLSCVEA